MNSTHKARILYVSRNDGSDTRITKECKTLASHGYEVILLGWNRKPDQIISDPMPHILKEIYVRDVKMHGLKEILSICRFYIFLIKKLFLYRPDYVHAVNEDLAFMVLPWKYLLGYQLICDVSDSLQLRYGSSSFPICIFAKWVCKVSWRGSDTDQARADLFEKYLKKISVVPNYPVDPGPGICDVSHLRSDAIWISLAGTLYSERGLSILTDLIEKDNRVRILCAGWLYDNHAEAFIELSSVEYLGIITPEDSLRHASECHAIFAFYDPVNRNNVMASPNKLYDAMCIGRPIIINSEALVSSWVQEKDIGYSCGYHDLSGLKKIVEKLDNTKNMKKFSSTSRNLFEQGYSWKIAETELLKTYSALH